MAKSTSEAQAIADYYQKIATSTPASKRRRSG